MALPQILSNVFASISMSVSTFTPRKKTEHRASNSHFLTYCDSHPQHSIYYIDMNARVHNLLKVALWWKPLGFALEDQSPSVRIHYCSFSWNTYSKNKTTQLCQQLNFIILKYALVHLKLFQKEIPCVGLHWNISKTADRTPQASNVVNYSSFCSVFWSHRWLQNIDIKCF